MKNIVCVASLATALSVSALSLYAHHCHFDTATDQEAPFASKEELMKNADVLWAGEGIYTYLLDERNEDKLHDQERMKKLGISSRYLLLPLKDQYNPQRGYQWMPSDLNLAYTLCDYGYLAKAEVFADADCKKRLSAKEAQALVSSIDTLVVFDPETKKELQQVVVNAIDPYDVQVYQIKQIVYFDQKANMFSTLVESIAPCVAEQDPISKEMRHKPLFWIKTNMISQAPDLHSKDIPWARRIGRAADLDALQTIKNTKKLEECIQQMLDNMVKNYKTEDLRNTMGEMEKLTPEEIRVLPQAVDTIIVFDPVTFEEQVNVCKDALQPKNIAKIRFLLEFYWDNRSQKMSCLPLFFAPIVRRHDQSGKFLNEGPAFYKPIK